LVWAFETKRYSRTHSQGGIPHEQGSNNGANGGGPNQPQGDNSHIALSGGQEAQDRTRA